MKSKDKIKAIIALSLVAILGIVFFTYGKDDPITKYTSGFCLVSWVVSMVLLNRKSE